MQLWALPEVRALTPDELEAHVRAQEEPEEDAEEAQADAVAADKAEEGRAASSAAPEVSHRSSKILMRPAQWTIQLLSSSQSMHISWRLVMVNSKTESHWQTAKTGKRRKMYHHQSFAMGLL